MTYIDVSFFSKALCKENKFKILITSAQKNTAADKTGVLYLLHGFSDSCESFINNSSVSRYLDTLPLYIVFPQADNSFYTDMKHGGQYWKHVFEEIPFFLANSLNLRFSQEQTFVGGVSMGGYGAIKWMLQSKNAPKGVFLFSPVTDIVNAAENGFSHELDKNAFNKEELGIYNIFDIDKLKNSEEDLLYKLNKCSEISSDIYLYIGKQDFLYNEAVNLNALLKSKNASVEYTECEGQHNWETWDILFRKSAHDMEKYFQ